MIKEWRRMRYLSMVIFFSTSFLGCGSGSQEREALNLEDSSWEEVSAKSDGQIVHFMMWQGSPSVNAYINHYVIPKVKERYNIDLRISGGQGPEIVQLVMGEKQAAIAKGQVDIVWINGETFFQLRKISGLWGPFVIFLPNSKFIDFTDPFIGVDFQQDIAYMECPWSINQFAMVYDTTKIVTPPDDLDELSIYLNEHPGTFTISNDFTGMTLLKSFLAELGGTPTSLDGAFDQAKYAQWSGKLWDYINKHKHLFWKEGITFPREQSKMDQLYASGELNLVFGFSEGGIEDKVINGLYPKSTRGYAWKNGTIRNSNYLGILHNSPSKEGAMQVINFMISPEAQLEKSKKDGMDANTILDLTKVPADWKEKFESTSERMYGPSLQSMDDHAIAEPAAEYMIRLYEDFRTNVIEK